MMGYTKKEMDASFDILDFAEIGDFVYQAGEDLFQRYVCTAGFALAINVDPEILIVDEALSVGDVFSRRNATAGWRRYARRERPF